MRYCVVNSIVVYSLALAVCIITVISLYVMVAFKRSTENIYDASKSTEFLDARQCDICFGNTQNSLIVKCSCDKIFHADCAQQTNVCPYCGTPYSKMIPIKSEVRKCVLCNRLLTSDICECGTVDLRNENSFTCLCGSKIDVDTSECPYCGAEYGWETKKPGQTV